MVPPNGARAKRIPALSWDSVVDNSAVDDPAPDDGEAGTSDLITIAPLVLDLASPADIDEQVGGVHVEPLHVEPLHVEPLHVEPPTVIPVPAAPVPAAPVPAAPVPAAPVPAAASPVETVSAPALDESLSIRTTPPAVIVPAIGDVTSGPDQIESLAAPPAAAPSAPAVSDALPQIQEATPVESAAPLLPSIPALAPRPVAATPFEFDPGSVAPAPTHQPRRRKQRRGIKLFATLLVLGGLVAAGIVFGQPYLFPGEWDDATAPYAEAVETASEVEFAEPLSIVAEPTADFATRLQTQFASIPPEELAQWRALGLASGVVDDATVAQQLSGWQDAMYSTLDGQVYHDLGVAGPELDAQLTQEMAAASLDQQFGWSVDQDERTLDAAAATSAEVLRQARTVQQASSFAAPVPPVPGETADALPAVVGYRMLAPYVFAEFDPILTESEGTNPLAGLGTSGPGILGGGLPIAATDPPMLDGDVVVAPPVAKDRSFWYLVFAGYLDARTAYNASEAIVENSLAPAVPDTTQCVSATFSGGGLEQTETLRSALTSWATAAPAEMASSLQVLPDGALQLVSCDPGPGFDARTRPGLVHELLAWRTAELATVEAARADGGGEAEQVAAWAFVGGQSQVPLDLMNVPPTATPAEMATAARDAVSALFAFLS